MITLPRDALGPSSHWSTSSRAQILLVRPHRQVYFWTIIRAIKEENLHSALLLYYLRARVRSYWLQHIVKKKLSVGITMRTGNPEKWISYEKCVISLTRPDNGPQGGPPSLSPAARDPSKLCQQVELRRKFCYFTTPVILAYTQGLHYWRWQTR